LHKSFFDSYNVFIRRKYRSVIIAWIVVVLLSLILIPSFFSSVSYDIMGSVGSPPNSESQTVSNILQREFPEISNDSENTIIIVVQGTPVYSDSLKNTILKLNGTLSNDKVVINYIGGSSLYSMEVSLLNESLPAIINQTANLQSNITTINSGFYSLQENLSVLSTNLFQMEDGINQTAQLVYGIPAAYVNVWQGISQQLIGFGDTNPFDANNQANNNMFSVTSNFGGNAQSIGYYTAFFNAWNASYQMLPNSTSLSDREAFAVGQAVAALLNNPQIDAQTSQMLGLVASGLTVTTWNQLSALENLTISTMASNIPSELSSSLGISAKDLVDELYSFGPSPSNTTLGNYAISLLETSYTTNTTSDYGFSVSDLIQSTYLLGSSPGDAQTWTLACKFISNATQSTFSDSPLFTVNSTSLSNLISGLSPNASIADIDNAIENEVITQPYTNYPFIPLSSLTKNFVNSNNDTMLIFLSLSSSPDADTIAQVKSDVQDSGLQNFGEVYVTGGSVLSNDFQITFMPALEITLIPGVAVSLLIVGLLFLAPIAAIIPVLVGGCSIVVSLASIYLGIVELGHGSLTFLTPVLTILLMLGLAVDYAVLQLKRTKEERLQGKSIAESVGISIRWAGQAVLTAGLTVIIAYIIMAVVNVPIFSQVGTAIALGVVILLAASLTLLPALEIALGDKIFWPGLNRHSKTSSNPKNILKRVAEGTLKKKVPIVIILSALSIGALFVVSNTPFTSDFQKLIPNFSSNQGVTVISDNFGSGTLYPTYITVTTPTEITYGNNQFNQTLLNQIDQITVAAASSDGVISVVSPTRPYGDSFDYSTIENMSEPLRLQHENAMFTMIGEDNKTVLITVGLSDPALSQSATNALNGMEKNINNLSLMNGIVIHFGGQTQSTYDSDSFMANLLPEVTIILSVAVYMILFFQLKSAFTPLRLIVTILCSVVLSLAIVSLIFFTGLNLPILNYAPLFAVVTMLGVGIDYDIFFLTRIREEVLSGKTDDEAIKAAVDKVWVTIFGLGLVLAAVFGSLFLTGIVLIQELSLAIAGAVLIDVTVVILFFVPALMGMAQKFNWWPYKLSSRKQPKNNTE
jgi:putative drug exporter of the RND superfamily